jgi:hypothetical protein
MEAQAFFSTIWGGLKDATNYISPFGGVPYLISRTVNVKPGTAPQIFYNWYSDAFANKNSKGKITLPSTIEDVGMGTKTDPKNKTKLTYIDFIANGKKCVILLDHRYMSIVENKAAFKMNAQKERVALDFKKAIDATVYNLQKLALAIIELKKKENSLNEAQRGVIDKAIKLYHAKVDSLKKIDGVKLSTTNYSTSTVNGLGIVPVVMVLVAVGVIVLGVLAYFTIDKMLNSISAIQKTGYETQLQTKALETLQKSLANPNLTKEEKQQLVEKTYEVVDNAEKEKALISKQEEKANESSTGSLLGTIKTISIIALVGGGLLLASRLIPKQPKKIEYAKA